MKLSIVDLATVAPGSTESGALADALETARHAESAGYHRIWFAEHHLSRSGASHFPELLIAAAATQTSRIRLGSGAVLLNHYSPFKVAEMFSQLEAMAPGRIDLGMGRATAGPVIDLALQQNREHPAQVSHQQQVMEVLDWLYETFPEGHPFGGHPLGGAQAAASGMRAADGGARAADGGAQAGVPQTWMLGSGSGSSALAGQLGVGYTIAGFINPAGAASALQGYRAMFRPQERGLEEPRAILAVNVAVGETPEDGLRLAESPKGFYSRLRRAGRAAGQVTVPSPAEAAAEMTADERAEPTRIVDGRWPRFIAGGPDQVRATLEQMIAESGADELMVQDLISDPVARRRSHALLAEAFGISPRQEPTGPR